MSLVPVNTTTGTVTTTTTTTDTKKGIRLGVGLGVGLGGGLLLVLVVLYFKVLRKKNIETGQKSAVMMTPNVLASAPAGSR